DGIRVFPVTGVQTCALPIANGPFHGVRVTRVEQRGDCHYLALTRFGPLMAEPMGFVNLPMGSDRSPTTGVTVNPPDVESESVHWRRTSVLVSPGETSIVTVSPTWNPFPP